MRRQSAAARPSSGNVPNAPRSAYAKYTHQREQPRREQPGSRRLRLIILACTGLIAPAIAAAQEHLPSIDITVDGVVAARFEEVAEVLLDVPRFDRWFPSIGAWQVLEQTEASYLVYGRQSLPWPLDDRDYVVEYRWFPERDRLRLRARSRANAAPATPPGTVRLHPLESLWTIEAAGPKTRVSYRYQGDAGGALPDWLSKWGWRSQAQILIDQLAVEVERRQAPPADSSLDE